MDMKENDMPDNMKSVLAQLPGSKPANARSIAKLNRAMQTEVVEKFKQREKDKQQRSVALAKNFLAR